MFVKSIASLSKTVMFLQNVLWLVMKSVMRSAMGSSLWSVFESFMKSVMRSVMWSGSGRSWSWGGLGIVFKIV